VHKALLIVRIIFLIFEKDYFKKDVCSKIIFRQIFFLSVFL